VQDFSWLGIADLVGSSIYVLDIFAGFHIGFVANWGARAIVVLGKPPYLPYPALACSSSSHRHASHVCLVPCVQMPAQWLVTTLGLARLWWIASPQYPQSYSWLCCSRTTMDTCCACYTRFACCASSGVCCCARCAVVHCKLA
jgi:hypothetical protein